MGTGTRRDIAIYLMLFGSALLAFELLMLSSTDGGLPTILELLKLMLQYNWQWILQSLVPPAMLLLGLALFPWRRNPQIAAYKQTEEPAENAWPPPPANQLNAGQPRE